MQVNLIKGECEMGKKIFASRLKKAWNAFTNRDPTLSNTTSMGVSYGRQQHRHRINRCAERSIIASVYNRMSLDATNVNIRHCEVNDDGRFIKIINSPLNNCLTTEANIDQTARAFIQDVVISMLDEGHVAIVPVDINIPDDPSVTDSYDIETMRTGKVIEWYPRHVKIRLYNDRTGQKQEIVMEKKQVAIIENPLYAIMNEPNSTLQRLIRKLSLLDVVDQNGVGKLDIIIQLPYLVRSDAKRKEAEKRRRDIEQQLAENNEYGIAYTDGTEKITQLNRSLDNKLIQQVEYLTSLLFSQLGITQSILDGTADDQTMLNYYNRSIEPIISAITDEISRKFLSETARENNERIMAFRDPFKLVPLNNIAEIADKFTRNEILTSNEIRQIIGIKPSDDPKADQLINSNIAQVNQENINQGGHERDEEEY